MTERVDVHELAADWAPPAEPSSLLRRKHVGWLPVTVLEASVTGLRVVAPVDASIVSGTLRRLRIDGVEGLVKVVWVGSAADGEVYYGCELVGDDTDSTRYIQELVHASKPTTTS